MMGTSNSTNINFSIIRRLPNSLHDISYDGNKKIDNIIKETIFTVDKSGFQKILSNIEKDKLSNEFEHLQYFIDSDQVHYEKLCKDNSKNRYSDIKPYSYNCVHLSTEAYINASLIHIPSNNSFIATQGPLYSTAKDFWQMVIDYNVEIIVMLCGVLEKGRQKCAEYWSDEMELGNIKVLVNEEKKIDNSLIQRKFTVSQGKIMKNVVQLHFVGWPDHGVPKAIQVYKTFKEMINYVEKNNKNAPVIVHCSAGVGRTGTFISLYNLYQEIMYYISNRKKGEISVFNLVRKLKEMRMFLVENILQYRFIYEFLKEFLSELLK